jgi:hypothetical protein
MVYNKYVEREVLSMADNKANKKKVRIGWHIGKVLFVALVIFSLLMNACVLYVLGAGDFGSAVVINGKDGVDGKDGIDGVDGKDGKDGINGKDGKDGINGKDGIDGKDGINGINGKDGADGQDGKDGVNGIDGKDGVDGKDGKDGKDGLTPYIGDDGMWWIGDTCTNIEAEKKIINTVYAYPNLNIVNQDDIDLTKQTTFENIIFGFGGRNFLCIYCADTKNWYKIRLSEYKGSLCEYGNTDFVGTITLTPVGSGWCELSVKSYEFLLDYIVAHTT